MTPSLSLPGTPGPTSEDYGFGRTPSPAESSYLDSKKIPAAATASPAASVRSVTTSTSPAAPAAATNSDFVAGDSARQPYTRQVDPEAVRGQTEPEPKPRFLKSLVGISLLRKPLFARLEPYTYTLDCIVMLARLDKRNRFVWSWGFSLPTRVTERVHIAHPCYPTSYDEKPPATFEQQQWPLHNNKPGRVPVPQAKVLQTYNTSRKGLTKSAYNPTDLCRHRDLSRVPPRLPSRAPHRNPARPRTAARKCTGSMAAIRTTQRTMWFPDTARLTSLATLREGS
nr:hypothetical protein CFP56_42270 [Quercus suber]